jgi:lysophospholipase L1-like esterase
MEEKDMQNFFVNFVVPMMQKEKKDKVTKYKYLNQFVKKGQILMVGSSLMENFPINELRQSFGIDKIIYNRGICGTVTTELLATMEECIFALEPSKMFINIGTNDIGTPGYTLEGLISNYTNILTQVKVRLPQCKVFVMAYYPVNTVADYGLPADRKEEMFKTRTNEALVKANKAVEQLGNKFGYEYIDVNEGLMDEKGNLKAEFAIEGLHMWPQAYAIVLNNLKKYL